MKVLISAYSCEPGKGSERGVGWNVAREVAKYHYVWVLTRPDESRDAIEAELARNPTPNLNFVYFTLPFWRDSLRWGQFGAMQIHYYLWQIQAYFVASQLHHQIGFDLVHHVTFVKYSSPSFLSLLPIPFIWGSVGGGESTPSAFWRGFSFSNKLYETLRFLARWLGEQDPFTHLTARRSAIAYATTEDTARRVRQMGADFVQISSETALSQQELDQLAQCSPPDTSPLRFISIARLLHWKGFHLSLRAFAQANLRDAEYWILGDGPEWDRLQALALDSGIACQVKFWGHLSRDEVLLKLGQCSILVHPSLHDSGGWVCLEAMAAGRPVICLDLGGPAEQVTQETGFKVPACDPEQTISALAKVMIKLAADKDLRVRIGKAGQQRVRAYYSWEAKGKQLAQVYETFALKKFLNQV
ncbi:MAG: glycosyltransferase family 4 protein [Chroococcidiopsidaceae cyanobacterium CP_BM_RX_35]|nr:glycosyltransferase family 4 protein [Chroococcidiopsidaceae cyanobacterium CP_BM_RX_35]